MNALERWGDWIKTCGEPTVWCGFDWPEIVSTYAVLPQPDERKEKTVNLHIALTRAADDLRHILKETNSSNYTALDRTERALFENRPLADWE